MGWSKTLAKLWQRWYSSRYYACLLSSICGLGLDNNLLTIVLERWSYYQQTTLTMKFSAALTLLSLTGTTNAFVNKQFAGTSARTFLGSTSTELSERKAFMTGNWKLNPQTKVRFYFISFCFVFSVTYPSRVLIWKFKIQYGTHAVSSGRLYSNQKNSISLSSIFWMLSIFILVI